MYKQDKATTERHARILHELVKRSENKVCADCKRNDARWASWNIGVFICIRCSGIHRSMGTHISKVKSVDLDTWTPDQMDSMQRWGNHRANLYWEAHLRPGHSPPEYKMESFIRSKYESRRWAREGPPPADPSILESGAGEQVAEASISEAHSPAPAPVSVPHASPPLNTRQPQPHRLLSTATASRVPPAQPVQVAAAPEPPKQAPQPQNDLFSLDFHAPSPSTVQQNQNQVPKDVKQNILSLFSVPASAATVPAPGAQFGAQQSVAADPFGKWGQARQQQPQVTSMMGASGTAMWGAQSGWAVPAAPVQPNVWDGFQNTSAPAPAPVQQSTRGIFETQSIWGTSAPSAGAQTNGQSDDLTGSPFTASATPVSTTQKKDEVFGNLWGDSR